MRYRIAFVSLVLVAARVEAADPDPARVRQARAILAHAVSIPTVAGRGEVPRLAAYLAEQLQAGGFAPGDIEIERHGETATLFVRYRGLGKGAPLVLSAHMDVVEARREDWVRDPFTLTEANGFLYGRGVADNKFGLSLLVASLIRLRQEGYAPGRDIVLAVSGDEETTMATTRALVPKLRGAWMVVNSDSEANALDAQGRPVALKVEAAEKSYATFELRVRNPGGHSSQPRVDNAIYQLAQALIRLQQHAFPVELNEVTRGYFEGVAPRVDARTREAMARLARDPGDAEAAALLSRNPDYLGVLRTTCVATLLAAGHAENALPQRAVATVNCRILPGTPAEQVGETLRRVIADPEVEVGRLEPYPDAPASPLRPELLAALRKAVDTGHSGLAILPSMSMGASDCLFFRDAGIDCFCVDALFMHPEDNFMHGLDERVPADAISPALEFWDVLLRELSTVS